jgi:hypothetical protein
MVRLTATIPECFGAVVVKIHSTDPKGSAISSQEIHGYISVITTLKFTFF